MTDETRARAKALLWPFRDWELSPLHGWENVMHGRVAAELARLEAERDEARATLESLHEECDRQLNVEVERLRAALARSGGARRVAVEALRAITRQCVGHSDEFSGRVAVLARAALDAQPEEPSECKSKWIPKSMIRDEDENEIQIPEWFAEKEGLI